MTDKIPVYICKRISEPFFVDGDLSKLVWQSIPDLKLGLASGEGKPLQSTSVRACWDGLDLYLAFDCQDSDIRATFTKRDSLVWQEEAVEAYISPYVDLRHYFEFQCSPKNVVRDIKVTNPNARPENLRFDGEWDCTGWQTAVAIHSKAINQSPQGKGWSAEWRIPLNQLLDPTAGPVLPGEEWRVNLFRIDRWPQEEYSSWSATPGSPFSFHRPTCFGRWIFE